MYRKDSLLPSIFCVEQPSLISSTYYVEPTPELILERKTGAYSASKKTDKHPNKKEKGQEKQKKFSPISPSPDDLGEQQGQTPTTPIRGPKENSDEISRQSPITASATVMKNIGNLPQELHDAVVVIATYAQQKRNEEKKSMSLKEVAVNENQTLKSISTACKCLDSVPLSLQLGEAIWELLKDRFQDLEFNPHDKAHLCHVVTNNLREIFSKHLSGSDLSRLEKYYVALAYILTRCGTKADYECFVKRLTDKSGGLKKDNFPTDLSDQLPKDLFDLRSKDIDPMRNVFSILTCALGGKEILNSVSDKTKLPFQASHKETFEYILPETPCIRTLLICLYPNPNHDDEKKLAPKYREFLAKKENSEDATSKIFYDLILYALLPGSVGDANDQKFSSIIEKKLTNLEETRELIKICGNQIDQGRHGVETSEMFETNTSFFHGFEWKLPLDKLEKQRNLTKWMEHLPSHKAVFVLQMYHNNIGFKDSLNKLKCEMQKVNPEMTWETNV